jgi:hypothetical protein
MRQAGLSRRYHRVAGHLGTRVATLIWAYRCYIARFVDFFFDDRLAAFFAPFFLVDFFLVPFFLVDRLAAFFAVPFFFGDRLAPLRFVLFLAAFFAVFFFVAIFMAPLIGYPFK